MKNLVISHSALSGNIYAGYLNPPSKNVPFRTFRTKVDVTSQVLQAIIEKVEAGNAIVVEIDHAPAYEIIVQKAGWVDQHVRSKALLVEACEDALNQGDDLPKKTQALLQAALENAKGCVDENP